MIKFGILLLYASFGCNLCGMAKSLEHTSSACVLTDAPNQCGAFCLSAQLPFIDHNYKVQGQFSSITKILNEALKRLEDIEKAQKESAANQALMEKIEKELLESKATVEKIQQENLAKMDKIEKVILESEKTIKEIQKIVQEPKVIPPGFQRIESRYFYIESENKQTWNNAEDTCRKMGGHLAAFKSRKELDAVIAKLRQGHAYWLGVSDQENEGDFVTASGNKPIFMTWGRGEPNNLNKREHCVDIYRGFMNDLPCNLQLHFICQLDSEV
ncbi:accessory gland protein Acp29AB-like [Drosophila elegans]|uniref:accessory gland protein Acp29AB-like n=1 Tax=Drosophila elegans TaxID=30023 RepID=UPI0007E68AC6|nr:accessory gland protein Acp29AB-like [Drosophila elegans]